MTIDVIICKVIAVILRMFKINLLALSLLFITSCNKSKEEETLTQEVIIEVSFPELGSDGPYEVNKV